MLCRIEKREASSHVAAQPQLILFYKIGCVLWARQRLQNAPNLVLQRVVAAGDHPPGA